ncbi:MAG: DJ-1/PfpI family protein [Desulfuromonadaceae bacterium]|nr:DJ-1/PfpI family protein [Desulfuromonadaceae bacterium]MDD5105649.1 DJ-1/PfpI family protein [Desulfuromonadaceae bacterium]
MQRMTVGILIFDDVEVLDYCGPYEVFCSVRLNEERRREEPSPFHVLLVAEKNDVIRTSGGMRVLPDVTTAECPPLDILLVPGGWGTRREIGNAPLLDWIAERATEVATLTSVCTGTMLLGKAGLLSGRHATTHWKSLGWMKELLPDVIVEEQLHVVRDGNVFTSAGISAGIDLALIVTAEYFGEDIARSTARHMEYTYPESLERRI